MTTDHSEAKRFVRQYLTPITRLTILAKLEDHFGSLAAATRRRQARQRWLAEIKQYAEHGAIALCRWSRDCDMCEGTSRTIVEAVPWVIDAQIREDFEWAEGPMTHWLQPPSAPFHPYQRDRALEAFEDGHPHVIYIAGDR